MSEDANERLMGLLEQTKHLAKQYRALAMRPLGVTGEIAEFEAARILRLNLMAARQEGYDATEVLNGERRLLQIKGRCITCASNPGHLGRIDVRKPWDAILMVLLDENFDATAIYEANRGDVLLELAKPGSRARNERGALAVRKFISIGIVRWQRS